MKVEKIADILDTSSEKDGRISALGCQHFSITSYLFQEKKKNAMKDLLKASISVKVLGIKYTEDPVGLPTYKESGQYSGCKSLLPCNK
jgi:hypothetical protein